MKKVRIGIIGAGWWGTFAHIPAIKSHSGAELVAVQSREKTKAEKIARDFGVEHACTSVGQILALTSLDAVIVSSTPNVHYEQARAALERGLHVLIEKPMTFTVREARELVEIAAKKASTAHQLPLAFHPARHRSAAVNPFRRSGQN